jgi:hypothetical protein
MSHIRPPGVPSNHYCYVVIAPYGFLDRHTVPGQERFYAAGERIWLHPSVAYGFEQRHVIVRVAARPMLRREVP